MTAAPATQAPVGDATPEAPVDSDLLLDIQDLRTHFHVMDGVVKAVDGVSFSLRKGRTLGVVGESGCQGVGTAAVSSRSTVCGRRPSSRAAK